METPQLKPRQPVEHAVESWDDDDFMIEGDDFAVISTSTSANYSPSRRESHSSLRSDFGSVHAEEEKQVHLPGIDEKSTSDAIAAAAQAGIPLPKNVPLSALMGGTIKRLGGRRIIKILEDDWGDDLVFPDSAQSLQIKPQDSTRFPDVLRQVSDSTQASPTKQGLCSVPKSIPEDRPAIKPVMPCNVHLERFRDTEGDDLIFRDGASTIKIAKKRNILKPIPLVTPPTPSKLEIKDDDFEHDFELPTDGKLQLSSRPELPKTPCLQTIDDLEWAEGSLGTRYGGTRRDARSTRSSSVSAMSPSIASSRTAESEDEFFDGLILPLGPINFEQRLKLRRQSHSPQCIAEEPLKPSSPAKSPVKAPLPMPKAIQGDVEKEDFLTDLDVGDGDLFDSKKPTLHRNIQVKETRPSSPSRPKTTVTLKFTTKLSVASRLPRPMGPMASHERTHPQSSLEPVLESGGSITHPRRSLSRMGHSAQSSVSRVHMSGPPSTGSAPMPSTPRRSEVGPKASAVSLRNEPTTTSAQLLRIKRSLPAMRASPSPARPIVSRGYERPSSRMDLGTRPQSSFLPKTPTERTRTAESAAAQARKAQVPFLPAGASLSQSRNVNAKSSRTIHRYDSSESVEFRPNSRAFSRCTMRSPSPRKHRQMDKIAQEGWQQLNKPRRPRQFGDGHELDGFDDLPTSSQAEARFMKQPVTVGSKSQMRNKMHQNVLPDPKGTPAPLKSFSPAKADGVPSFARDTTASRIARETILAQRTASGAPVAALTAQRVAQLSSRANLTPTLPQPKVRSRKLRKPRQTKPHLIANLNASKESKIVNGMFYNPDTWRWEGNDKILCAFDAPASSPSTTSATPREREAATPRPALITNIGSTKGVQVVGGMVFDPQYMRWIKFDTQPSRAEQVDMMDGFNALDEDEDVFKDIPDLEDRAMESTESGQGRAADTQDDWLVGEEFDVGPEFIRRQREEEERWRKKCGPWLSGQAERDESWRWAIRDIVLGNRD